jgi:hypothetical protein
MASLSKDDNAIPAIGAASTVTGSVITLKAIPTAGNGLRVAIVDSSGNQITSFGLAATDGATFTQNSSSFTPVGGVYQSTPDTLTTGQSAEVGLDINRNLRSSLGTLIAGEDIPNNRLKVVFPGTFTVISTAATTTVKSGAGYCFGILVTGGVSGTIIAYDNTAGSGTQIANFDQTNTMAFYPINASFSTGLTVVTGAATKLTLIYA